METLAESGSNTLVAGEGGEVLGEGLKWLEAVRSSYLPTGTKVFHYFFFNLIN